MTITSEIIDARMLIIIWTPDEIGQESVTVQPTDSLGELYCAERRDCDAMWTSGKESIIKEHKTLQIVFFIDKMSLQRKLTHAVVTRCHLCCPYSTQIHFIVCLKLLAQSLQTFWFHLLALAISLCMPSPKVFAWFHLYASYNCHQLNASHSTTKNRSETCVALLLIWTTINVTFAFAKHQKPYSAFPPAAKKRRSHDGPMRGSNDKWLWHRVEHRVHMDRKLDVTIMF